MGTFIFFVLIALILFGILKLTKPKKTIVETQQPPPIVETEAAPIVVEKPKIKFQPPRKAEFNFDYVVIDFEYADKRQYACQLGIVTIKNNEIVDSIEFLIQPPDNQYGVIESRIHGINAEKTYNSPTFIDLWGDIYPYFANQIIVCHNSVTDITVLNKTCAYYNLHVPSFEVIDTIDVFGKVKLTLLAESFGVKFTNHHNALSDAYVLAEIFILYNKGFNPEILKESKKAKRNIEFSERKIDSNNLIKNLDVENKTNPFYNKIVVITGIFQQHARNDVAIKFKSLGADVNGALSKKTHYVMIGKDAGPSKLEKIHDLNHQGANIQLLYENDLEAIFDDDFTNIKLNEKP